MSHAEKRLEELRKYALEEYVKAHPEVMRAAVADYVISHPGVFRELLELRDSVIRERKHIEAEFERTDAIVKAAEDKLKSTKQ